MYSFLRAFTRTKIFRLNNKIVVKNDFSRRAHSALDGVAVFGRSNPLSEVSDPYETIIQGVSVSI